MKPVLSCLVQRWIVSHNADSDHRRPLPGHTRRHLHRCPRCRAFLDTDLRLRAAFNPDGPSPRPEAFAPPDPSPRPATASPRPPAWRFPFPAPLAWSSAAVLILVAALALIRVTRTGAPAETRIGSLAARSSPNPARLLDSVESSTETLWVEVNRRIDAPLQHELESLWADTRGAARHLARNFIPTAYLDSEAP